MEAKNSQLLVESGSSGIAQMSANSQRVLKQTFTLLKYTFIIVPIVAGADKFFNLLTDWPQYLNGTLSELLPISSSSFMMVVGIIEIAAGFIVWKNPKIGGYIVGAWLSLIALTLLIQFNYVDVAVRDLVIAIAAFAMSRLARIS